jgi:hypothetical protein
LCGDTWDPACSFSIVTFMLSWSSSGRVLTCQPTCCPLPLCISWGCHCALKHLWVICTVIVMFLNMYVQREKRSFILGTIF